MQTVELHACRKEKAQLIEARRTANFSTMRAHVDVAQDGWVFHQVLANPKSHRHTTGRVTVNEVELVLAAAYHPWDFLSLIPWRPSLQGMDFDGFNLMRKPALRDKPNLLVAAARGAAGAVAVNTNGWIKSGVAVRASKTPRVQCPSSGRESPRNQRPAA
jgi:hypothetical protein